MTPEEVADFYAKDQDWHCSHCQKRAERLLANCRTHALEEAARVAEQCEVTLNGDDPFGNEQIAAAIRALKDKP